MNGWTQSRRKLQSQLIQKWKPWEQSTGPKSDEGKQIAAHNALKHGMRSKAQIEELRWIKQLLKDAYDYNSK